MLGYRWPAMMKCKECGDVFFSEQKMINHTLETGHPEYEGIKLSALAEFAINLGLTTEEVETINKILGDSNEGRSKRD